MFACLKQDHEVMREMNICPNFASVQILNFKHKAGLGVKWTVGGRHQQTFDKIFVLTKHLVFCFIETFGLL